MGASASALVHKLEYGLSLTWSCADGAEGNAYIEVESPLDQNRPMGDGPRPWAQHPRYSWLLTNHNQLHVAGWLRERVGRGSPDAGSWKVVDVYIPWDNVIKLQVHRHDDWEGKASDKQD